MSSPPGPGWDSPQRYRDEYSTMQMVVSSESMILSCSKLKGWRDVSEQNTLILDEASGRNSRVVTVLIEELIRISIPCTGKSARCLHREAGGPGQR